MSLSGAIKAYINVYYLLILCFLKDANCLDNKEKFSFKNDVFHLICPPMSMKRMFGSS